MPRLIYRIIKGQTNDVIIRGFGTFMLIVSLRKIWLVKPEIFDNNELTWSQCTLNGIWPITLLKNSKILEIHYMYILTQLIKFNKLVLRRLSIVCHFDPVHENITVCAGCILIYTDFTVYVAVVLYGLNFGSNCRKLGPVLYNWFCRFNRDFVKTLNFVRSYLKCVGILNKGDHFLVHWSVSQDDLVPFDLCWYI